MSVNLSILAGAGWQFFSDNGVPLSGGLLYTYAAGTTTPQTTYTSSSGAVPNANPIVLNSAGRVPSQVWLTVGSSYKFLLQNSAATQIWSQDNIQGLSDLSGPNGSSFVGYLPAGTGAVATTVQAKLRESVSVKDFGATGDGVTNDSAAIQAAINTTHDVFFPNGTYNIASTLYYAADGQTLYGENVSTFTSTPLCSLVWVSTGGTMVSFATGSTGYSNCALKNIRLNGDNKANIGVDVSNGQATYRNLIDRVFIEFVNYGSTPTGIALGLGSFPSFSNDTIVSDCYLGGCSIGVSGAGSTNQFISTTILGAAGNTAVQANPGAYFSFLNCVFSAGAIQIDATSPQAMNFVGCWMENSTTAIYKATTSSTVSFVGCYLHTSSATNLMDMGNAAGNFSLLNCFVPGVSASTLVKNVNQDAEYSVIGTNCTIDPGYRIRTAGSIRADNSGFAAGLTSDANNITGDGTVYNFNTVPWTEQYDLGSSFAAATGIFTASLFGYYQFTGQLSVEGVDAAHTDANLVLVTTAASYQLGRTNAANARTASDNFTFNATHTVFMSPNDTAFLQLTVSNGTKVIDVTSGSDGTSWRTRFEGRMV